MFLWVFYGSWDHTPCIWDVTVKKRYKDVTMIESTTYFTILKFSRVNPQKPLLITNNSSEEQTHFLEFNSFSNGEQCWSCWKNWKTQWHSKYVVEYFVEKSPEELIKMSRRKAYLNSLKYMVLCMIFHKLWNRASWNSNTQIMFMTGAFYLLWEWTLGD